MTSQRSRVFHSWNRLCRIILPTAKARIPSGVELERHRRNTARGIVARQAEGSVLLAAGRFDMSGVDLSENDDCETR